MNNNLNCEISRPSREQIAVRAYELFVQRGCRHGSATEDWFQAESELLQLAASKASAPSTPLFVASKSEKKPAKAKTAMVKDREINVVLPKRTVASGVKRIGLS